MSDFSMELNEDQIQIQKWVPPTSPRRSSAAAHEWDEARRDAVAHHQRGGHIGCTRSTSSPTAFADPTGLTMAMANEEMSWGDAGMPCRSFGRPLAVARHLANARPSRQAEWIPQCFGTPDDIQAGGVRLSEPDAGSDVSSLKTRRSMTRPPTNGAERHEDVDHQWRHRQPRT